MDHLAICENGVWDKGGEPSGIVNDNNLEDDSMENQEMPAWADALMKRMDSLEAARADAAEESEKKEEAKADSDEKKEEEAKADSDEKDEKSEEKADSAAEEVKAAEEAGNEEKIHEERAMEYADSLKVANEALQKQIAELNAKFEAMNKPLSNDDREQMARAQARADSVYQMFGENASAPIAGETPIAYRRRLAAKLQKHSKAFKDAQLSGLTGDAFDAVESIIYADAQTAAKSPVMGNSGRLIPITRQDAAGRTITTYEGDIGAFTNQFAGTVYVATINKKSNH